MDKLPQGQMEKLRRIILAALLPPLLPAIYLVYAEVWPTTLLIKLQAEWFGGYYYPKATVLAVYVGILVVFELIPLAVVLLSYGLIAFIRKRTAG